MRRLARCAPHCRNGGVGEMGIGEEVGPGFGWRLPVACGGMEKGLLSAVVVSEGGYENGADGEEDLS